MNTKSIFLALCCLAAFSSYAQHVPTLEEVVNGGLIVTKGESRVNWLSEGNSYSKLGDTTSFRIRPVRTSVSYLFLLPCS